MPLVIALLAAAWAVFGSPRRNVSDLFWPNGPTPWETIDALYYPDKTDLRHSVATRDLRSLPDCRNAVRYLAWRAGDAALERSDYVCGVGIEKELDGTLAVYRLIRR